MAVPKLKFAIGNSASTTLASGMTNIDTTATLTATTNFDDAPVAGEGMVLFDEGEATEELAYSTGLSGSDLTVPLVNRGLEGGSAQAHSSTASVRGPLTAGMWNDLVDALVDNVLDQSTGAVDGTKVMKITSGDGQLATGGNIQVNSADPKRAYYVPATAMVATTTNGAASGSSETSTNKVMVKTYDFDSATDEFVQFQIPSPKYWNASTVTAEVYWTASSSSGDVIWGVQGLALSNDDALDTAFGTAQTVTDTLTATGDVCITSATSAITIGNSPAAGDWLVFQVYRDANAGGDTLGADAKLLGVRIQFTVSKYDDA